MKKYLLVFVSFLLILTGCNLSNDAEQDKEAALNAYVRNYNKLVSEKTISVGMNGSVAVPKSVVTKDEINGKINGNLLFDLKKAIFNGELEIESNINNEEEKINLPLFFNNNYLYLKADNQWLKIKDDNNFKEKIAQQNDLKIDLKQAEEIFANLNDIQYFKSDVNGVKGYEIKGNISVADIMKALEENKVEESKDELKIIKGIKVNMSIFIPEQTTGQLAINLNINVDSALVRFSIDNFIVNLTPSNKEVKIDSNIEKNAISMNLR